MSADRLLDALRALDEARELTENEAFEAVGAILDGQASDALASAFLTALRFRGESAGALTGAVRAARQRMIPFEVPQGLRPILDTCGTGGDGARSFNVSTAAALVVAACGVSVIKHGNRSATGNCGSAEVLQTLGLPIEAEPERVARGLAELGIAFLFAPLFHPALRALAPIRKQLPFRTIFNLIGPLANPARPERQLVGAAGAREAQLMAGALIRLGLERGAVVTAQGLDEVSLDGPTRVAWIEDGTVAPLVWTADDFGLPRVRAEELRVDAPEASADAFRRLVDGEHGPVRSVVLANAAAALRVADRADDLREGVALGSRAIDSGAASDLLVRWINALSANQPPCPKRSGQSSWKTW